MPVTRVHRCLPRAGLDPIDSAAAADLLAHAIQRPFRHETIVLLLDAERRGISVVVVDATSDPDSVVEIVELLASPGVGDGRVGAMVVGTVRSDEGTSSVDAELGHDVERWMELSEIADQSGVELIEWFVVGPGGVRCPRDQLGEPPRW